MKKLLLALALLSLGLTGCVYDQGHPWGYRDHGENHAGWGR
jgi:hypothetical protein